MHWKLKAALQNAISLLPESASYATYYRLQRVAGGLKRLNPVEHLAAGIETWRRMNQAGRDPVDKIFFEVGTGRTPIVPLAFWLLGAKRIITVDVNPYLKEEYFRESVDYIEEHHRNIEALFGFELRQDRSKNLSQAARSDGFLLKDFLELCCIDDLHPADAASTGLPPRRFIFIPRIQCSSIFRQMC